MNTLEHRAIAPMPYGVSGFVPGQRTPPGGLDGLDPGGMEKWRGGGGGVDIVLLIRACPSIRWAGPVGEDEVPYMIRVSSMRNRIPNLWRGAACALSLAFLAGVPLASPAQTTYTLPAVVPPADSAGREGFLRIVNRSFQAGVVRIHAFDDTGERFGPVTLELAAGGAVHLTSRDLERGSVAKGLPEGVGDGEGSWRLEFDSALDVVALGYIRTSDGFLTSMHDVVPVVEGTHRVLFFNPGSNTSKASHLRIVNPGTTEAEITVMGRDDAGDEASGTVQLTLPAGGH